jgi:hypothetical protein
VAPCHGDTPSPLPGTPSGIMPGEPMDLTDFEGTETIDQLNEFTSNKYVYYCTNLFQSIANDHRLKDVLKSLQSKLSEEIISRPEKYTKEAIDFEKIQKIVFDKPPVQEKNLPKKPKARPSNKIYSKQSLEEEKISQGKEDDGDKEKSTHIENIWMRLQTRDIFMI